MKKKKRKAKNIDIDEQAQRALNEAVDQAVKELKAKGIPIAVWKDGKVVKIPADQL